MLPPRIAATRLALFIAAFGLCSALLPVPAGAVVTNGKLQVIHLDAGQGDGAVIITPGGQVALVDEGTNFTAGTSPPSCARVLSELQALGVTHVDLHFASHYHADHIGCITSLTGITIDQGWDRGSSYTTTTYTNYVNYLGAKRHTLSKGQVLTLDAQSAHPVTITCVALAGDGITTSDENSKCVVLKVSYGEFDEVMGGDLTGYPSGTSTSSTNIETKVGPQVGPVEVYKVHHHGSAYGSYDDWLNATTPKIGIISCGTGNGYGHPTSSALTRLHNHGVHTYWTETGSGATPSPAWDKVANDEIRINAVWQAGGVDSVLAPGIADAFTNSGTADAIAPSVTVLSPNGGESYPSASTQSVTWSASDNIGVSSVDVDYSMHGSLGPWVTVQHGIANTGSVSWQTPDAGSDSVLVRVTASDQALNQQSDVSDGLLGVSGSGTVGVNGGPAARFILSPPIPSPSPGAVSFRFSLAGRSERTGGRRPPVPVVGPGRSRRRGGDRNVLGPGHLGGPEPHRQAGAVALIWNDPRSRPGFIPGGHPSGWPLGVGVWKVAGTTGRAWRDCRCAGSRRAGHCPRAPRVGVSLARARF